MASKKQNNVNMSTELNRNEQLRERSKLKSQVLMFLKKYHEQNYNQMKFHLYDIGKDNVEAVKDIHGYICFMLDQSKDCVEIAQSLSVIIKIRASNIYNQIRKPAKDPATGMSSKTNSSLEKCL